MRAGEIRALARAAGIAPGVSVLDLCCGVAGPGRFITRELGCALSRAWTPAPSAIDIARERAGDLPCRFEVARIPPLPPGPFDVVLLLETMLAFPDKATLLRGDLRGARRRRALRLHPGGGPAAHRGGAGADARRRHGLAHAAARRCSTLLERAGLVVRWQDGLQPRPPGDGGFADRRVCRRRDGHRRADRAPCAGRAAGRSPALERVAARTGRVRKIAFVAEKP